MVILFILKTTYQYYRHCVPLDLFLDAYAFVIMFYTIFKILSMFSSWGSPIELIRRPLKLFGSCLLFADCNYLPYKYIAFQIFVIFENKFQRIYLL